MKEKVKKILNIIVLVGWYLGNLMIFSAILFLSYEIANKGEILDNLWVFLIMLLWVFGQMNLIKDKRENKK